MATLLELSHELLHCILVETDARDLAAISATCQYLNNYVRGNDLLHKEIYARHWDVPAEGQLDWEREAQDIVRLGTILRSSNRSVKDSYFRFVAERINFLVRTAHIDWEKSWNIRMLSEQFQESRNIDAFLAASSLFDQAGSDQQRAAPTEELRQLSAKLHCLYGVPIDEVANTSTLSAETTLSPSACTRLQTRPHLVHTFARSRVYDLREYTEETLWGPFMSDGSQRVDWEKVEAVMVVLGHNFKTFSKRTNGTFPVLWKDPFAGATPMSYASNEPIASEEDDDDDDEDDDDDVDSSFADGRTEIMELVPSLDSIDPYGVTGTWMRVVCFLDYSDLYYFNFRDHPPVGTPRSPIDTEEGMLEIIESWRVIDIVPPGTNADDPEEVGMDWSTFQGQRLPVVHFAGTSRSLHTSADPDANSKIRVRGSVRQTPEGEIRWTTLSIFHGEERWRSESIQVGGLRSARGVIGNWFDKDRPRSGPAGPTAFWKESDDVSMKRIRRVRRR